MANKGSGKEYIEHKANILANIGEFFSKQEISDVTLVVGEQIFYAHRFALATQSKVFMTMLMGDNWKESVDKTITLQESSAGEILFSDFLKFFYTGTLILTIDNVCGIHTLADKYDVTVLKDDCIGFMRDVLTGIHGDALYAGLEWLQYIESFLPVDIATICYSAIRRNFGQLGISTSIHRKAFEKLSNCQVKNILSTSEVPEEQVSEQLVLCSEFNLLQFVDTSQWGDQFLPIVRFYNIDVDRLQSYVYMYQTKHNLEKYYNEAYKVHAERSNIATKACKKRRRSSGQAEVKCPCDVNNTRVCPHINPRLYLCPPFAQNRQAFRMITRGPLKVFPIDLSDLDSFLERQLFEEFIYDTEWTVSLRNEHTGDPVYECFTVAPHCKHVGRKFTIAIACLQKVNCDVKKFEYVIKYTGEVIWQNSTRTETNWYTFVSPLRLKDSCMQFSEHHAIFVTILLHKPNSQD